MILKDFELQGEEKRRIQDIFSMMTYERAWASYWSRIRHWWTKQWSSVGPILIYIFILLLIYIFIFIDLFIILTYKLPLIFTCLVLWILDILFTWVLHGKSRDINGLGKRSDDFEECSDERQNARRNCLLKIHIFRKLLEISIFLRGLFFSNRWASFKTVIHFWHLG